MARDNSLIYTLLTVSANSWVIVALCASGVGFIGLIFFMVGLLSIIDNKAQMLHDWILLSVGMLLLALTLSMLTLCRIAVQANNRRRRRRRMRRRRDTHPALNSSIIPLPIWSVDSADFYHAHPPPPAYSDAIKCSMESPLGRSESRPPSYSPPRQSVSTNV